MKNAKKEHPEYKAIHSQLLQDVLRRVDITYKNFFDKRANYPRFKDKGRYFSITYPQVDKVRGTFCRLSEGYMYVPKNDAGWGKLLTYLDYKAQKNGKRFIKVPPNGTSQTCICGANVPKDFSVRVHTCPKCGYTDNRDIISAKIIELRGLQALSAA